MKLTEQEKLTVIKPMVDRIQSITDTLTRLYVLQGQRIIRDPGYSVNTSTREYAEQLETKLGELRSRVLEIQGWQISLRTYNSDINYS